MLLTGPDEIVESIFSQFDLEDPNLDKKADDFLHTAVGTMLDVISICSQEQAINSKNSIKKNGKREEKKKPVAFLMKK